jgi:hypothetical protein
VPNWISRKTGAQKKDWSDRIFEVPEFWKLKEGLTNGVFFMSSCLIFKNFIAKFVGARPEATIEA